MFVQSERFVEAHGRKRNDIAIYGQESNVSPVGQMRPLVVRAKAAT